MASVKRGGGDNEMVDVVSLIPILRAFARKLCSNPVDADDLVQETLLKATASIDQYQPGTRLKSWLFTIMRNTFYNRIIIERRELTGGIGAAGAKRRAGGGETAGEATGRPDSRGDRRRELHSRRGDLRLRHRHREKPAFAIPRAPASGTGRRGRRRVDLTRGRRSRNHPGPGRRTPDSAGASGGAPTAGG
jgi:RNA polymerase sigma factor (sigma-70 family)